jgi:monofunctional biosynthetic peptidoglycan transglycosylase
MNNFFKKLKNTLIWILLLFLGSSILSVIAFKYLPVPCTPLMFIRAFEQIGRGEEIRMKHQWVDMEDISNNLPLAVWASEDQRFLIHSGFDIQEIKTVIKENEHRGASTISQQTAKNIFLWPESSWLRKGFEVYFTMLIEVFWDKERIMEVYLNSIEMGDGIYGAEAVAHEHFNCTAANLTKQQSALIAASLPNPLKFNSSKPSRYMYKRQTWILRQMRNLGGHFPSKEEIKEIRDKG